MLKKTIKQGKSVNQLISSNVKNLSDRQAVSKLLTAMG
jgi:hypothetical protein